ncbi:hypothetical protein OF385_11320 [Glutamicibacter sp. JL.03c]|uniref:hypothetical protein n=1 Tax=Glutamicibacter sp. JL.03c TaxID=2984842 RepID=UPI0021F6E315|nr:hypothetical protein [Glutamicibacter sp. JL.03c]UYQ76621.1 hypothetical protein OF385_11320 [Glutamicibacter sp. JL.03c]
MRIKVLLCGLVAVGLLTGAASLSSLTWPMGVVTAILQLVFAYAWPRMVRSDAPWPITIILALCSLASTAATIFMPGASVMSHSVEAIAVGVLLMFISQVLRGAEAEGRLAGVVSGVTGMVLAVLGSAWAASAQVGYGFGLTVVTAISLLGAGAVVVNRLPNRITMILAPLVAAALGAASSALPVDILWFQGAVMGLLAGLLVGSLRALALASRSVRNLSGILGLSCGIILLSGAASWYAMEVLAFI